MAGVCHTIKALTAKAKIPLFSHHDGHGLLTRLYEKILTKFKQILVLANPVNTNSREFHSAL